MHIFMPMLKDRFIQLLLDQSVDSVLVQKQIFKILYALFQVMVVPRWLTLAWVGSVCWWRCRSINVQLWGR